jgi:transposase
MRRNKSTDRDRRTMAVVHPNAAAIDVGATMHMAAVNADRTPEPVRSFGTFTTDLHRLVDWFSECGVDTVVMESTSIYWIPIFELLDARGFAVSLVNARDAKHALRRNGMTAPCTIDGTMNGGRFLTYVKRCLAPTLQRNDIVMLDNLPAHKATGVREAIEARGATLRFLPKYSPDLNPIEMSFSQMKAGLRNAGERTIPRLRRRLGWFARNVTAREAANYFAQAGYA